MRNFLGFLLAVLKVYISIKVMYVLYMTSIDSNQDRINELIWWSSFLIFDIWITGMLPSPNIDDRKNDDDNDSYLEDFRK